MCGSSSTSAATTRRHREIVSDLAAKEGYELRSFTPQTIDNDLRVHDHCRDTDRRPSSWPRDMETITTTIVAGIKVDVIMGRTPASLPPRPFWRDNMMMMGAPYLCPRSAFDEAKFLADRRSRLQKARPLSYRRL